MARRYKSTYRENTRVIGILQKHLAEEKRILAGYGVAQEQYIDVYYDMDKHMNRVALIEQLMGEIALDEENE